MHGIEIDWRLPLVLMLLSTAGVMAGLVLRIRSFLILGITFSVLDIIDDLVRGRGFGTNLGLVCKRHRAGSGDHCILCSF